MSLRLTSTFILLLTAVIAVASISFVRSLRAKNHLFVKAGDPLVSVNLTYVCVDPPGPAIVTVHVYHTALAFKAKRNTMLSTINVIRPNFFVFILLCFFYKFFFAAPVPSTGATGQADSRRLTQTNCSADIAEQIMQSPCRKIYRFLISNLIFKQILCRNFVVSDI